MGYFSNGCEGHGYRWRWCDHCANDVDQNCKIWLDHILHNYEQPETDLMKNIPRTADGLGNQKCKAFKEIVPGRAKK